jgi:hypothetical protein
MRVTIALLSLLLAGVTAAQQPQADPAASDEKLCTLSGKVVEKGGGGGQ